MSHLEQRQFMEFIARKFPDFFAEKNVLEIGSLNINGSIRDLFINCNYIGVDLENGPGVDLVGQGQKLDFPDDTFETVISTECFEHNPYWRETFANMIRMCNGLVIVTAAGSGRPEHGTRKSTPQDSPFTTNIWDYYKNIGIDEFLNAVNLNDLFLDHEINFDYRNRDFQFWGIVKNSKFYLRNKWHVDNYRATSNLDHKFTESRVINLLEANLVNIITLKSDLETRIEKFENTPLRRLYKLVRKFKRISNS